MSDLVVQVNGRAVGVLRDNKLLGEIDFEYLAGAKTSEAVSLTMPVGADPQEYRRFNGLPPPFEVSLPEGAVLAAIRRRFAKYIDIDDDFELLRIVGRHTVGRVTFGGPRAPETTLRDSIVDAALSHDAAKRLQQILDSSPQFAGVSGAMPKMSFPPFASGANQRATLIGDGAIVKFDAPEYVGASLVEYACLQACKASGLSVPDVRLSPDHTALIVQRFDIAKDGHRLGFEDACALSGLRRTGKYRGSVQHLFRMLDRFVADGDLEAEREKLLRLLIMNDVLRNGDAHLKNFGLLYGDDLSKPHLAPVYDVLTTPTWIRGDLPALPLRADDFGIGAWLDAGSLRELAELASLPGLDVLEIHAACRDIAIQALTDTLKMTLPGPQAAALKAALSVVEAGRDAWCSADSEATK